MLFEITDKNRYRKIIDLIVPYEDSKGNIHTKDEIFDKLVDLQCHITQTPSLDGIDVTINKNNNIIGVDITISIPNTDINIIADYSETDWNPLAYISPKPNLDYMIEIRPKSKTEKVRKLLQHTNKYGDFECGLLPLTEIDNKRVCYFSNADKVSYIVAPIEQVFFKEWR